MAPSAPVDVACEPGLRRRPADAVGQELVAGDPGVEDGHRRVATGGRQPGGEGVGPTGVGVGRGADPVGDRVPDRDDRVHRPRSQHVQAAEQQPRRRRRAERAAAGREPRGLQRHRVFADDVGQRGHGDRHRQRARGGHRDGVAHRLRARRDHRGRPPPERHGLFRPGLDRGHPGSVQSACSRRAPCRRRGRTATRSRRAGAARPAGRCRVSASCCRAAVARPACDDRALAPRPAPRAGRRHRVDRQRRRPVHVGEPHPDLRALDLRPHHHPQRAAARDRPRRRARLHRRLPRRHPAGTARGRRHRPRQDGRPPPPHQRHDHSGDGHTTTTASTGRGRAGTCVNGTTARSGRVTMSRTSDSRLR